MALISVTSVHCALLVKWRGENSKKFVKLTTLNQIKMSLDFRL